MSSIKVSIQRQGFELCADIIPLGNDYIVILGGGVAHIGAVAIAQPNININNNKCDFTTSIFTLMGHKEDIVVQNLAKKLSQNFRTNFVVIAGLHWDNITHEQINLVLELVDNLGNDIISTLFKKH